MMCSGSESEDDEGREGYRKGGYHAVRIGDRFSAGRYVAQRKLGWGNFSTVWLAYDTLSSKYVAIKIQKSAKEYAESALHEIDILSSIAQGDASNSKCVIKLLDHFKHGGPNGQHQCLVTEFLGDSLLKLIRYNRKKGIGLHQVRQLSKSVLAGLDYLHRELGIIHTDLKPENVLLVSTIDPTKDPTRTDIPPLLERPEGNPVPIKVNVAEKWLKLRANRAVAKISSRRISLGGGAMETDNRSLEGVDLRCKIVDFGNAVHANEELMEEIQTREYRAPEVIIGSGYSFSADMWSFACLVFELATGDTLFVPKPGEGFTEDEDHLAQMMELLGKMPKQIAVSGSRSKDYFDRHGDLKRIRRLKFWPMDKLLVEKYSLTETDANNLSNFLCPLLDFDPEKRPTASQCLVHKWITDS
ncbi:Kinase family protein [Rhynchospora pubera]|uniref:non-specific serine/threonine protein kinase n=1 Tax=Rhynchospora pubera TaxID=906938 RepID=A0AAV8E5Z6_9POAL|nr:Kinase family protein [Rhynchospora pubera]